MKNQKLYHFQMIQDGANGVFFTVEGSIKKVMDVMDTVRTAFTLAGSRSEGSPFCVKVSFDSDRPGVLLRILEK